MSNSNVTPAQDAESIYQMLKERTLSQEAFGVDIDYVFTPSDRLETPLPLYVRRQAGFEEASDEDIAQARIWFYRDNRVLFNIPYSPEGEEGLKRSEYLLRVLGAADGRYCRRHQPAQVPDRVHPGSSLHDSRVQIRSG